MLVMVPVAQTKVQRREASSFAALRNGADLIKEIPPSARAFPGMQRIKCVRSEMLGETNCICGPKLQAAGAPRTPSGPMLTATTTWRELTTSLSSGATRKPFGSDSTRAILRHQS